MTRVRTAAAAATVVAAVAAAVAGAAPTDVSIAARSAIVPWAAGAALAGSISGGAGEAVHVEAKECGLDGFRLVAITTTGAGGSWTEQIALMKNTTFRARWKGSTSGEVTVRTRPGMILRRRSAIGWEVVTLAGQYFHDRLGELQRFDSQRQRWVRVATFRMKSAGATTGVTVASEARFTARVPRGALVRATLPNPSTGPCYLAGFSNAVRR
ncbi:MAG TPA: hypothetical protein VM290_03340 [Gaiellaceae bacterium]|nr:hypothetical protein [Gaiellaceae bacterium]